MKVIKELKKLIIMDKKFVIEIATKELFMMILKESWLNKWMKITRFPKSLFSHNYIIFVLGWLTTLTRMDPVLQFDSFPLLSTLFFTATVLPAWVAAQCVKVT